LSLAGGAVASSLMLVVDTGVTVRAAVAGLGLAYVLYRLHGSRDRTGRVVVVAGWGAIAAAAWLFDAPLSIYLGVHAAMIWLIRSLYAYTDLRAAALDLGLSALALAFAIWAALRSESFFLAAWCFFLIQALHVAIPASMAHRGSAPAPARGGRADVFAGAHQAAEHALRRIAARR
jgi:hypothetical protein